MRYPVQTLCVLTCAALLSSCGLMSTKEQADDGIPNIVPTAEKDSGPAVAPDLSSVPDAVPRQEQRTSAGNKSPYKVKGVIYHVMSDPSGYSAEGIASWYGNKFHGQPTSSGERYDMYAMTAAHPTLPIPSYVRVTNLDNGKSVVVRVNDRGPFEKNRLIDLSYAAAHKLGYERIGTARVRVDYIEPDKKVPQTAAQSGQRVEPSAVPQNVAQEKSQPQAQESKGEVWLQLGAFHDEQSARNLRERIESTLAKTVAVEKNNSLWRVQVGPVINDSEMQWLRKKLADLGFPNPFRIFK